MKKIILLFAAGALAVSFSSCGGDSTPAFGDYNKDAFWIKPTGMTIDKPTVGLILGGTDAQAKDKLAPVFTPADTFNKNVAWKSSNEKVVTVSNVGELTAIGIGTATITGDWVEGGGLTMSSAITVSLVSTGKPVQSLTLDATAEVEVKGKVTLTATVVPADATGKDIVWSTADDKIATVDKGVVTGVKAGTVKITAMTKYNEKVAECTVTVKAAAAAE